VLIFSAKVDLRKVAKTQWAIQGTDGKELLPRRSEAVDPVISRPGRMYSSQHDLDSAGSEIALDFPCRAYRLLKQQIARGVSEIGPFAMFSQIEFCYFVRGNNLKVCLTKCIDSQHRKRTFTVQENLRRVAGPRQGAVGSRIEILWIISPHYVWLAGVTLPLISTVVNK